MTKVPNRLDEVRGVLLGRRRLDAVPEVHHVPHRSGLPHNLLGPLLDRGEIAEEDGGIEVALHPPRAGQAGPRPAGRDALPALGHVDRPIERHDVDARGGHALDERSRVLDVRDRRNVGVFLLDLLMRFFFRVCVF